MSVFSPAELAFLLSVPGVGRKTIYRIMFALTKGKVTARDFWVNYPAICQKISISNKIVETIKKTLNEYTIAENWQRLIKRGIRVIDYTSPTFPHLLKQANDVPPVLFIKSKLSDQQLAGVWGKNSRSLAVVGSRQISSYGKMVTQKLVGELVAHHCTIVSGCMYGVDERAHLTAIEHEGTTVGVLGYGFDHCYPASKKDLLDLIVDQNGVLVSEYPPPVAPQKGQFAARNRIIANLSLGVLVTQAAIKSGSLITAALAIDEGRTVYAVPGSITSPYTAGTKWLVNQGAMLVSSGEEILTDLGLIDDFGQDQMLGSSATMSATPTSVSPLSSLERVLYDMLVTAPMDAQAIKDELATSADFAQIGIKEINQALSWLELNGRIGRNGIFYELL